MVKSSKGYRNRTRNLLSLSPRKRGMRGLSRLLQTYEPGQKVTVDLAANTVKGMPHRRYQGRVATIVEKRGRAYVISVQMGGMVKTLIARPEHLRLFTAAG